MKLVSVLTNLLIACAAAEAWYQPTDPSKPAISSQNTQCDQERCPGCQLGAACRDNRGMPVDADFTLCADNYCPGCQYGARCLQKTKENQ